MDSNILPAADVSSSALNVERARLDVIASNIANAQTTNDVNGGPYRRKHILFESVLMDAKDGIKSGKEIGVRVAGVVEDKSPLTTIYNPSHPHADEKGMVAMPNVNIIEEMVDLMTATRAYEANTKVVQGSKKMVESAMRIGQ
ncbi:MAG: flagellar basal body rod protein FlgC [Verrucomicrobiota bacterium]